MISLEVTFILVFEILTSACRFFLKLLKYCCYQTSAAQVTVLLLFLLCIINESTAFIFLQYTLIFKVNLNFLNWRVLHPDF